MRKLLAIPVIVSIALSTLAGEAPPPGLENTPAVVAEIEGHPISRNELIRELVGSSGPAAIERLGRRILVEQAAAAANISVSDEEIEQQYKADTHNLLSELTGLPWDKTLDAKGNIIGQRYKELPMEDLLQARFRMSVDEYKKLVIRQKILMRRCVAKDLNPTVDQLRKFFNEYSDMFHPPVKYHAAHILISPIDPRDLHRGLVFQSPVGRMSEMSRERQKRIDLYRDHNVNILDGPNNEQLSPEWIAAHPEHLDVHKVDNSAADRLPPEWLKAEALAEKVLRDIKSGVITWDQAVRQYSLDPRDQVRIDYKTKQPLPTERSKMQEFNSPGDLGWFHENGPLVHDFYDGAKNVKPGEVGGPVKTWFGYHLVKMIEIQTPPPVRFEDCIEKIREAYIENAIQLILLPEPAVKGGARPPGWLDVLASQATVEPKRIDRTLLWPPRANNGASLDPVVKVADNGTPADPDPIIVSINGTPIHRSEVWRELLRSEGDEALDRLMNREVIMTILKPHGVAYLEWLCTTQENRAANPPPQSVPIKISTENIDRALTDDRLRLDAENEGLRNDRNRHEKSFAEFIYEQYGQKVEEYKRSVEATLILAAAIGSKVPTDEATLKVQFALARDQYTESANYEISHILIAPGERTEKGWKAALDLAEYLRAQCEENPNKFDQLVKEYSDDKDTKSRGGNLGKCFEKPVRPSFPEEAEFYADIKGFNVGRGQFTPVIKSTRGYHIVRVDSVHSEHKADFEEVKFRLARDYINERAKMYSDIWLRELNRQARVVKHFGKKPQEKTDEVPDNFNVPQDKK